MRTGHLLFAVRFVLVYSILEYVPVLFKAYITHRFFGRPKKKLWRIGVLFVLDVIWEGNINSFIGKRVVEHWKKGCPVREAYLEVFGGKEEKNEKNGKK